MRSDESQFIESLNSVPVEEIFGALERECRLLENRSSGKRRPLDEAAASILVFRRFINAAMLGVHVTRAALPAEYIKTYRESVARLVGAGKLPAGADKEFDRMFSGSQR